MTAKDLRIGNYVASSSNPDNKKTWVVGKVCSIASLDSKFEQIEVETQEDFTWFFKGSFFGIPLTKEWHEKFGVNYNNALSEYVYIIERNNNFNLKIIFSGDYVFIRQGDGNPVDDDIITIWNKDLTKRDMYVHEWQNLFYLISGKELLI